MSAILDVMNSRRRAAGNAREARLATLSDDEIVNVVYELVGRVDDDDLSDDLYAVLCEAFERFAPMSEWRNDVASVEDMSSEQQVCELAAVREAMARRARARIMGRLRIDEEADDAS